MWDAIWCMTAFVSPAHHRQGFGYTELNATPVSLAWVPQAKQGRKSLAVVLQPKSLLARYKITEAGLSAVIWHLHHSYALLLSSCLSDCHSYNVDRTRYRKYPACMAPDDVVISSWN
jgi:hypothetical protein